MRGPSAIVCGVDDSAPARGAAMVAAALASHLDLRLVLVHAAPVTVHPGGRDPRDTGERLLAQLSDEIGQARVCRRLGSGAPAEQVGAAAVTEAAALVVLGTSGDAHPRGNRLGRVPRRLLATAPCAVVAVPPGASEAWRDGVPAGRVICGVGGDRDATCAESAACLAWGLGRRLRLVHVAPSARRIPRGATGAERDREGLRLLYRVLAGIAMPIDGDCEVAIEHGRPVDALDMACSTDRASLLVIGGRRAATARRTRTGTIARHLACSSEVPIVVVPS